MLRNLDVPHNVLEATSILQSHERGNLDVLSR